ncbi:MAG: phosphodiester glycosidase family protein [Deltaproteobacteria bacterium]|nr:phosphodiester glycosidase family protein [Deltaproteobacteria bacterium]
MAKFNFFWAPFFFILAASPVVAGPAAEVSAWQLIEEGLETRDLRFEGPPYQTLIKLRALRIDPERFELRILDSRSYGPEWMEIKTLARKAQALAAINGGFFLPDFRPLGLLIVDGKETNPLRKTDWGIFLVRGHQPRIIHTRDFQKEESVSQALQVGPRLVVEGRALRLKRQVARRSALGITFLHQVILVCSKETEVYAQDLARIFRLPEAEGGLECRDALALDGGPSAQMFADYKGLKIHIMGGSPVPNGIGVFKRSM